MSSSMQRELYDTREITGYSFRVLWLLFTLFIFYGTLIPFEFIFSEQQVISRIKNFNWVPFFNADGSRHSIPDVVQNILFFVPFGFLGVLSFARNKFFAVFAVTFLGFIISLNVEILQLFTANRITNITDLVTNTLGTGIGAVSAFILVAIFSLMMKFESFRQAFNNQYYYLFILAFMVIVASSLQPFDFTLDVSTVWSGVKYALTQPVGLSAELTDEIAVGFRLFLFAVITCLWLRSINNSLWPVAGIMLSASIGVSLEFSQFIVVSRSPSVQDIFVVLVSCTAGGVMAFIVPKRIMPIVWLMPCILITFFAAAVQTLAPFEWRMQPLDMSMKPFLSYYHASTFSAMANFLEALITYFPLGFLLQFMISSRRSAFIIIVIVTGLAAYGLEYAQGWVEGRYPDITDVIAAVIGAAIAGSLCLRWSRVFYVGNSQVNEVSKENLVT